MNDYPEAFGLGPLNKWMADESEAPFVYWRGPHLPLTHPAGPLISMLISEGMAVPLQKRLTKNPGTFEYRLLRVPRGKRREVREWRVWQAPR